MEILLWSRCADECSDAIQLELVSSRSIKAPLAVRFAQAGDCAGVRGLLGARGVNAPCYIIGSRTDISRAAFVM